MFGSLGIYELAVIVGVAVVVFGASRIPDVARSLGQGIKEFKKASKEILKDPEPEGDGDKKKD
jgi:sec-independent protein translocase protein TatA